MWYETIKSEQIAKWQKYPRVWAENKDGEAPIVYCEEANMIRLEDGTVFEKSKRTLSEMFTAENANEIFDLENIETGEVVGQIDYKTAFTMLYSVCRHLSKKAKLADEQAQIEAERRRLEVESLGENVQG